MENKFNLIDEAWIPILGGQSVSLRTVFSDMSLRAVGGNPVQKMAVMKLLLAICQAAKTVSDEVELCELGSAGLSALCLNYLDKWHHRFYLYGDEPFLQIRAINKAKIKTFGALLPEVSTASATVLKQTNIETPLSNADKALCIVVQMAFSLGGKKVDHKVVLTKGYQKRQSGKPGPAVASMGLLHNIVVLPTLLETLWVNQLTDDDIASSIYSGIGIPPWESLLKGEDCDAAKALKGTLIGRLVPMSRFCLIAKGGLHYSEGLDHDSYLKGQIDPTVSWNTAEKHPKVLCTQPDKTPWRQLPALLSFLNENGGKSKFSCLQLKIALSRCKTRTDLVSIWSGGLCISSRSGEQYVSGSDDYVDSDITFHNPSIIFNESWMTRFTTEIELLDSLAKYLDSSVRSYFAEMGDDNDKPDSTKNAKAAQSTKQFWMLAERHVEDLVDACDCGDTVDDIEIALKRIRNKYAGIAEDVFNKYCPNATARQISAWVKTRPSFYKYINQES